MSSKKKAAETRSSVKDKSNRRTRKRRPREPPLILVPIKKLKKIRCTDSHSENNSNDNASFGSVKLAGTTGNGSTGNMVHRDECDLSFVDVPSLKKHKAPCHGKRRKEYMCVYGDCFRHQGFLTVNGCKNHGRRIHKVAEKDIAGYVAECKQFANDAPFISIPPADTSPSLATVLSARERKRRAKQRASILIPSSTQPMNERRNSISHSEVKHEIYLRFVHKGKLFKTLFKMEPTMRCDLIYRFICSKMNLNMKRVLLLNERCILTRGQTVKDAGLLRDNVVYLVDTIRDQCHVVEQRNDCYPTDPTVYLTFVHNGQFFNTKMEVDVQRNCDTLYDYISRKLGLCRYQLLLLNGGGILELDQNMQSLLTDNTIYVVDTQTVKQYDKTGFQIYLKAFTGKTIALYVYRDDSILTVKKMLADKEGDDWSVEVQRLIYAGRQLEDDRMLSDYNIPKEGTLHVVKRLQGS